MYYPQTGGRCCVVYSPTQRMSKFVSEFQPCFRTIDSFVNFATQLFGFISKLDANGVASTIEAFEGDESLYHALLHNYRSTAYKLNDLVSKWASIVKENASLKECNGRVILCGDGTVLQKEGRRMPAVKPLHQDSGDVSKSEFTTGFMCGGCGVLANTRGDAKCILLNLEIQDGMREAASWEGAAALGIADETHVQRVARMCFGAAQQLQRPAYVLVDSYFMTCTFFNMLDELEKQDGAFKVDVITRAKTGCKAFEPAPERQPHKRGRSRKRGNAVKIFDQFEKGNFNVLFMPPSCSNYRIGEVCVLDLLWREPYYFPMRFVLVRNIANRDERMVLASTDLELSAYDIIELYCNRWSIEVAFREYKQDLAADDGHFWSKACPKRASRARGEEGSALSKIVDPAQRRNILKAYEANSRYIAFGCFSTGIVELLSATAPRGWQVPGTDIHGKRQDSKATVSKLRKYLRRRILRGVLCAGRGEIIDYIRNWLVHKHDSGGLEWVPG